MILFPLPKVNRSFKLPGINSCAIALLICTLLILNPFLVAAFEATNRFQNPVVFPLKGKVTGNDNEPLGGVSIKVKGVNISTSSDARGNFALNLPSGNATLEFTHVGFLSKEIPVNNQLQLDVSLQKNAVALQEAVVVGYATQKKASVVGAISSINNEALNRRGGVSNLSSALSGQIGGVTVLETTGEPGRGEPQILIRGQSTWNGSQPLILVDGIERRMNDVSVNEVATISVLKDASATAVFGVKGANGVILITTKRGQAGKPKMNIGAAMGLKNMSRVPDKMEAYEAQLWKNAAVEREVATNEAAWKYYLPYEQVLRSRKPQQYPYLYPNVDWKDEVTKDFATNYRANMDISGGTDFATYFASMSYVHEGDIFASHFNEAKGYNPGYGFDRFNFRGNLDFKLTKTTKLQTNINGYTGTAKKTGAFDGSPGHIYRAIFELAPDAFPVYYEDGLYGKDPVNQNYHNPVSLLQETGVLQYNRKHIGIDLNFDQRLDFITRGLSAGANLSWDSYTASRGPDIQDIGNQGQTLYKFVSPAILDAKNAQDSMNAITIFPSQGQSGINEFDFVLRPWTTAYEYMPTADISRAIFYQARLSYQRKFGVHDVTGLAIFNRRQESFGAEFPRFREDWVGRATYNYDGRYFAEVNGAYNGSEKFAPKYRFGFFPSMALGWMMSEEKFLSNLKWLDKLKVRGSWGKVGSDAGIPRWAYVGSWLSGGTSYFNNNNGTPLIGSPYGSYREGVIPNENITWETAIKQNLGLELSVLQEMFSLELDVFKDNREGIFMSASQRNIPVLFGAAPVPANLGKTETKGYELSLSYTNRPETKLGFGYWARINISSARDRVLVSEDPALLANYLKVAGFQIGQTKSQVRAAYINNWDDIYASSPLATNMVQRLPGDWDIVDYNGDGVINTFDNVAFGYPTRPANTYSATLGFSYRNFSVMAQLFAVTNVSLRAPYMTPSPVRWSAVSTELRSYWRPDNTNAYYQAPRLNTSSPTGDFGLYDGSYLRLKTAEIAYSLPEKWMRSLKLSNVRTYINGNNLIFWSDLPLDTETGTFDIQNAYPMLRQVNIGIDISL
jgi:TonB-linked SusC/RagA family outer membrane protein